MLNLGSLEFVLGVNTSGLNKAVGALEAFGRVADQTQMRANKGFETNIGTIRKVENALLSYGNRLANLTTRIQSSKLSPDVKLDLIKKANDAYKDLAKNVTNVKKVGDATHIDRNFAATASKLDDIKRSFGGLVSAQKASEAANTKSIPTAQRMADAHVRAWGKIQAAVNRTEKSYLSQQSALTSMVERARNLSSTVGNSRLDTPQKVQLQDAIQGQSSKLRGQLSGPEPLNPRAFTDAKNQYIAGIGELRRKFQELKAVQGAPAIENFKKFQDQMQRLGSTMLLINGHFGGMSTRMFALGSIAGEAGLKVATLTGALAGAGLAITGMVKGSIDATLKIQKASLALEAVTGSSIAAAAQLKYVKEVSNATGQEFTSLAKSYSRYYAAAEGAGQSAETTAAQFRVVAQAAGVLSLGVEDTEGVFRALEQMFSKGSVQSEELRGQLGDRLPKAFQIAADAMGVTTAKLQDMMKKGQVASQEFVPKFINALKAAYNIDVSKPVESLQASMNRATNSVTAFFYAFAQNTAVIKATTTILEGFAKVMNYAADNMGDIIVKIGSLTAAVAGAAVGWYAWTAAITAWTMVAAGGAIVSSFVGSVILARQAMSAAAVATNLWSAAIIALNTVMTTAPWGKLIGLVLRLALAVGTAVLGYQMMNKWMNSNNAAMANISGIQAQIAAQISLGFQVRSTTAEIMKQIQVLAMQASAKASQMSGEAMSAARSGLTIGDWAKTVTNPRAGKVPAYVLAQEERQKRIMGVVAETQDATRTAREVAATFGMAKTMSAMPLKAPGGGTSAGDGGAGGKGGKDKKGAADNISQVERLIADYSTLKEKMDALGTGPKGLESLDSLNKARDALRQLSASELKDVDAALKKAGFSTGELDVRLGALIDSTKKGETSVKAFIAAWEEIDEIGKDAEVAAKRLEYFTKGSKFDGDEQFDELRKAMDMLKDMDSTALEALKTRIESMPGGFSVATASVQDLAEALQTLMGHVRVVDKQATIMQDFNKQLEGIKDSTRDTQIEIEGLTRGLKDQELSGWVKGQQAMAAWAKTALENGVSIDTVTAKLKLMNEALSSDIATNKSLANAQRMADFGDGMAKAIAGAAGDIVTNFGNIGDAAKNLLKTLTNMFVEEFVTRPLYEMMRGGFSKLFGGGKKKEGASGALDSILGGGAANDNGVSAMSAQANTAALALQQLTTAAQTAAMTMGNGGASGTGITDSLSAFDTSLGSTDTALDTSTTNVNKFGTALPSALNSIMSVLSSGKVSGGGGILGTVLGIAGAAFGGKSLSLGGISRSSSIMSSTFAANAAIFAEGGMVRGPGTSTSDSISAQLSDGEFVFNARAVKRYGVSHLMAMNDGKAAKFAKGGLVGGTGAGGFSASERHGAPLIGTYAPVFPNVRDRREILESEGQAGRRLRRTMNGPVKGR